MKLNSKKIVKISLLLFILLISLAFVSAEELSSADSDDLALSDNPDFINVEESGDLNLEATDIVCEDQIDDSSIGESNYQDIINDDNGNENGLVQEASADTYSISVNNVAATENTDVTFVANVEKNNVPASSGFVKFFLWRDGSTDVQELVEVAGGQGILNIKLPSASNLSVLNWLCLAAYYDEYGYYQANTTFTAQIKRAVNPTEILASNVVGKMDKAVSLVAYVYDVDGLKVTEGTVTFTVNGKSYKVAVKNGKATKSITTPFMGTYTVKVKYNGVGAYKSSSSSFKLLSDLKVKSTYYKTLVVKKGAKKYYKITLTNYYTKKPLKSFKLKFKVKVNSKTWKTYTLKSNSKGIINWSTKSLSKGTHNVVVSSAYKNFKLNFKGKIVVK